MKPKVRNESTQAKLCFEHIGGKLGEWLLDHYLRRGWLVKEHPADKTLTITKKGKAAFRKMGVDTDRLPK